LKLPILIFLSMDKKVCNKCNLVKDLTVGFYKRPCSKDGYENTCIECRRSANAKAHKQRYCPDRRRNQHLQKKYLINDAIYQHMLLMQNFKCAICDSDSPGKATDKYFAVDHCHKTGSVRGLLCHPCNTALGSFKDNTQSLKRAIDYLEKFEDG